MRFGTLSGRFVIVRGDGPQVEVLDVATASDGDLPYDVIGALAQWDDVSRWAGSRVLPVVTSSERTSCRTINPPARKPMSCQPLELVRACEGATSSLSWW